MARVGARGPTHAERGTVGDADGQVGDNGEQAVGERAPKGQVVRDFVDGEEQVLVGGGAEDVGDGPEPEGPEGRVAKGAGEQDLEGDDAGDDVFGQRLGPAELCDLAGSRVSPSGREKRRIKSESPRDGP